MVPDGLDDSTGAKKGWIKHAVDLIKDKINRVGSIVYSFFALTLCLLVTGNK